MKLLRVLFWLPLDLVRGVRRLWILHRALQRTPCPASLQEAEVRVRMGAGRVVYDHGDDRSYGAGAWCAMILFLRDPYLELDETTWFRIESEEGRCLVHARRFPDGSFEVIETPG
jgi:hypothetical protein